MKFLAHVPAALVVLLLTGCGCSDDSEGLKREIFPRIEVEPEQIVFSVVPIGQTVRKDLTIRNAGGAKLRITDISFSNAIDGPEFTKPTLELPLILESGEVLDLPITYAPQDEGTDSGLLFIRSNDANQPEVRVPISTNEGGSLLIVTPTELAFGRVDTGETKALSVRLSNVGTVPIQLTSIGLDPESSADFAVTANGSTPKELAQGDFVDIEVTYAPAGQDADVGTLVIGTSDPDWEQVLVPLRGYEPSAEIDVSPPSVSFGAVDLGGDSDVAQVHILNLGNAPLVISEITFAFAAPPTNEQYRLHELPDEWPLVIEGEEEHVVGVSYHPRADGRHVTAITIRSNDRDEPLVTVPVSGRVRRPCISVLPEAVDLGRVALGVESIRQQVQIANCGDLPLAIEDVRIEGAAGFQWAPPEGEPPVRQIAPLETARVEVWYENRDLAEDVAAEATLTIRNNTPDRPTVEVPLTVLGGGAPFCDLLILPPRVDFGLVSRGRSRTREPEVLNRGTGPCEVRRQEIEPIILIPLPGFNQVRFFVTRPLPAGRIAPGARVPVEITYRPEIFANDQAKYIVTYFDPFRNEERRVEAALTGVGGESNIEVIPRQVEFGQVTAGECASRTERVTVYNTGIVDLCVSDIRLEGPSCDEFFIVERPVADRDGCIIVTRNSPADIHLVYEPGNLGADACHLVFESDATGNGELRVPLSGEGVANRNQVDEFEQTSGRKVDVLFVVDNSGSMGEEQQNLANNFATFIRGAEQFQNEYQIGVVTTDMEQAGQSGRLQGNPRILRRSPQVEQQFRNTVNVGTNGSGDEKGLAAAQKALADPLIFDTGVACQNDQGCVAPDRCIEGFCGGHNRGFLRADAALEIVFISDEEDSSAGTLNFYVDFFKNIKGFRNEGLFHAHAIVGAVNGQAARCQSGNGAADAGRRYVEVAQRTNGGVHSICDANFGDNLREIGNSAFGLPVQFFLSRPAIRASIQVSVDGRPVREGWQYDEASNSVVFDEARVPQAGSRIRISYEVQCFPRQQ